MRSFIENMIDSIVLYFDVHKIDKLIGGSAINTLIYSHNYNYVAFSFQNGIVINDVCTLYIIKFTVYKNQSIICEVEYREDGDHYKYEHDLSDEFNDDNDTPIRRCLCDLLNYGISNLGDVENDGFTHTHVAEGREEHLGIIKIDLINKM